ncbi:protein Star [Belonocnema kinseyi]|uniref:protein Star n=1 Tax=Belonocnema kinseyi TaxID=2817044 RepID=UPI00143DE6FF|nr:protein Star [Belonocnema kinseyi]
MNVKMDQTKETKKMPPTGALPSISMSRTTGNSVPLSSLGCKKKSWRRKVIPYLACLAPFSTILAMLFIWDQVAEFSSRRQAFDANLTRKYVLDRVSMDNPQLVSYIREVQLKPTSKHGQSNVTQTEEEKTIVYLLQGKRDGVYLEYINRMGAISTTSWLESELNWRGVMVLTDPKSSFHVQKSKRNPRTRVLHACLSTDKDTKEIPYHQESEVQVTKLGEGPNSLLTPDESFPTTRLKCFPLYSVLLAYNATTIDYLSLDSSDAQDEQQVLDTIPWDKIRISLLSIHWSSHHGELETKSLIDKLSSRRYKLHPKSENGKLMFLYTRMVNIKI